MFFCINNDLDNKDLEEEALDVDVTFAIIIAVVVFLRFPLLFLLLTTFYANHDCFLLELLCSCPCSC